VKNQALPLGYYWLTYVNLHVCIGVKHAIRIFSVWCTLYSGYTLNLEPY